MRRVAVKSCNLGLSLGSFHNRARRLGSRRAAGKRQQRDVARALDGHAEPTLMARANSGHAARQNLAAFLHELRENVRALVVDEVHLLDTKLADFLLAEILALAAARASRTAWTAATGTAFTASTATRATFTAPASRMSTAAFAAGPPCRRLDDLVHSARLVRWALGALGALCTLGLLGALSPPAGAAELALVSVPLTYLPTFPMSLRANAAKRSNPNSSNRPNDYAWVFWLDAGGRRRSVERAPEQPRGADAAQRAVRACAPASSGA